MHGVVTRSNRDVTPSGALHVKCHDFWRYAVGVGVAVAVGADCGGLGQRSARRRDALGPHVPARPKVAATLRCFSVALIGTLLCGCMANPPLRVGYVYTVALKPGTAGVGCFPTMTLLHEELMIETRRASWKDIEDFDRQNGILLQAGDKATLLATYPLDGIELSRPGTRYDPRGTRDSKLKLRILRTSALCYAYNGGAGPGLTLFELCLPHEWSVEPCPASAPYPLRKISSSR